MAEDDHGHGHSKDDHGNGHSKLTKEMLMKPLEKTAMQQYVRPLLSSLFYGPVTWFHENVTSKVRTPYPYYHEKFDRVPTVDTCAIMDMACLCEADIQYKRDRLVDGNIVRILRSRKNECMSWYDNPEDYRNNCVKEVEDYEVASTNYYIKYGELGWAATVKDAYMKQKHRLLWERDNGPIGSRSKAKEGDAEVTKDEGMIAVLRRSFNQTNLPKNMKS